MPKIRIKCTINKITYDFDSNWECSFGHLGSWSQEKKNLLSWSIKEIIMVNEKFLENYEEKEKVKDQTINT